MVAKACSNTSMLRCACLLDQPERAVAEGRRHHRPELVLFTREVFQRQVQIARHQHLQAVAVEADELTQEAHRKQILPFLVFLLKDDLTEDGAGDILSCLRIVHDEIFTPF